MRNLDSIYKQLFKAPTSNTYIQLFRYLFAGALAFGLDVSLLYGLTEYLGVYYLLSSLIAFLVGLIITYVLSVLWIFDERRTQNRLIEIAIFGLIGGVGIILTGFFMWVFTSVLLLYYLYSKLLTTIIVFVWNFLAKKGILFTKRKEVVK